MRRTTVFLALFLLAAGPEHVPFDTSAAFRSVLEPEQARTLSGERNLVVLAGALTPQQRQKLEAKLHAAESKASDPRDLAAIHQGYLALKNADGAWRIGDALVGRHPEAAAGYTMRGQAAELRGDLSGAASQAREALRRDPNDRVAHALLRLTEGRGNTGSAFPATTGGGDAFDLGDWNVAASQGVSAEALSLMEQAVAAQHARDFPRVRALAQAAMKSDPKSEVVQRFYAQVEKKRYELAQQQVGLYAAMQRHEAEARAHKEVAAELEAARRKARQRGMPPLLPLSTGGVLLALGMMAWTRGGREEAQRRLDEAQRVASAGLIVLGCAGVAYGATQLLLAVPPAMPPALVVGPGGAASAVAKSAVARAGTAVAAGGSAAQTGYSFAKGDEGGLPEPTKHGSERFSDLNPTRGGVLSTEEAAELKQVGRVLNQKGGGKVYVREIEAGKFDVYVESEAGKPITSFRHIRLNKLQNLARNYGWE